jgi:hypothetical protein
MKKVILVFLILQIVGYSSLMTMQKSHAEQLDFLSAALPSQIGLWTAESKDRMYDRETIFSYIDGAGEVYRAYNMRSCLSRRYTSPNAPAIVLRRFHPRPGRKSCGRGAGSPLPSGLAELLEREILCFHLYRKGNSSR